MVYLVIKELAHTADDVMMVTSSLTKDMNSKDDLIYRPNAVRALAKITDPSMMQGIERFIKQSIVDKNQSVSCAALVSAHHLFQLNKDVVKRWSNEVQEAISSKGLLYLKRKQCSIPRAWLALSNEVSRQNGGHQNGSYLRQGIVFLSLGIT